VLVAPTVMPELANVVGAACCWLIAMVTAPAATTALPPITAASIFTLVRLMALTVFAPLWMAADPSFDTTDRQTCSSELVNATNL
jgi:hypothetical protein